MSEYQFNSELSQSNRANDTRQQNAAESIQIIDNRSQSSVQRAVQLKLAEGRQMQSADVFQRTGEDEELPLQGKFKTAQLIPEEEEPLQGRFNSVQLESGPEEEEPLQGKFQTSDTTQLQETPNKAAPNTTGLPDNLKSGVENLSGYSLDTVNVHYNSDKPAQLQALAYTQGTDIHVAPGQEQHLPHEAWHVVQQMQGRVEPTIEMNGNVPVNDDKGLENEADTMGSKANSL